MIDGRRRGIFGKVLSVAVASAPGGLVFGVANLTLSRAATSSSAPTAGDVSYSACATVEERCTADPFCAGCTAAIGGRRKGRSRRRLQLQTGDDTDDNSGQEGAGAPPELCSARYPILVSGSSVSFCERVGVAKCCEFSDNDAALSCMADPLSAEYWGCFFMDEVNCELSDMPCHASYRATASPTAAPVFVTESPTSSPTSAPTLAPTMAPATPTIAPTVAAAVTPSPTAGSRGGLDPPTPGPTLEVGEELEAGEVDAGDVDAEGTSSNGSTRVFSGRETMLAGVVAAGVAFLSAGARGVPLAR